MSIGLRSSPEWLDLVQIVDRAVVGVDGEFVPGVDQARGIENGADIGLAVFRFENRKTAQLRQSRFPTLFDALQLLLMNLISSWTAKAWFNAAQQRHAVIEQIDPVDHRQASPMEIRVTPKD